MTECSRSDSQRRTVSAISRVTTCMYLARHLALIHRYKAPVHLQMFPEKVFTPGNLSTTMPNRQGNLHILHKPLALNSSSTNMRHLTKLLSPARAGSPRTLPLRQPSMLDSLLSSRQSRLILIPALTITRTLQRQAHQISRSQRLPRIRPLLIILINNKCPHCRRRCLFPRSLYNRHTPTCNNNPQHNTNTHLLLKAKRSSKNHPSSPNSRTGNILRPRTLRCRRITSHGPRFPTDKVHLTCKSPYLPHPSTHRKSPL